MVASPGVPRVLLGVLVGLAICQVGLLLTTVFLHRALAHRALSLDRRVTMVFRVLTWMTTGVRPRQWVAVHRKHHAFTDVEGDPHSPLLVGFATVQLANVVLYRRVARDKEVVARYARDLPPDRWDRLLFDHAFLGLGIGVTALCWLLGWRIGLLAGAVHAVAYLLLNAAINAVGHMWGRQPYENLARNNQWLAWLTFGEGLHNNHHAAPTSARLALAPNEIDPAWWLVRLLRSRGWATVRHAEPRIKGARPAVAGPAGG